MGSRSASSGRSDLCAADWGPTAATAGKLILATVTFDSEGRSFVYAVDEKATSLPQPVLALDRYRRVTDLHWLPSGRGFVIARQDDLTDEDINLNEVELPSGRARQRRPRRRLGPLDRGARRLRAAQARGRRRYPGLESGPPLTHHPAMSTRRVVHPPMWSAAPGYSHAVATSGRPLLFVSGQVSLDAEGNLVGAGDFEAQVEQAFQNLRTVLAAAGVSFDSVLKLTYFVVGLDDGRLKVLREVRNRFLGNGPPPASTLLGVQALARTDFLVEVEAVAELPAI